MNAHLGKPGMVGVLDVLRLLQVVAGKLPHSSLLPQFGGGRQDVSRTAPTNLLRSSIWAGTMWFESLTYQPAAQFDRGRHHDRYLDI